MVDELQPRTDAGLRAAALTEEHARDFATRADLHDREGSFPFENVTAMQRSGLLAACVPAEFGGLGVTSMYDATLCIARLAHGDEHELARALSRLSVRQMVRQSHGDHDRRPRDDDIWWRRLYEQEPPFPAVP